MKGGSCGLKLCITALDVGSGKSYDSKKKDGKESSWSQIHMQDHAGLNSQSHRIISPVGTMIHTVIIMCCVTW